MSSKRGIRNNNPGNIDRSTANKWQGRMPRERMTQEQRDEKRFEVFASPAWGIRAMCVLLITYFDRHGCNTVQKIINRWAPPVENDTGAYVAAVAKAVGVKPADFIDLHNYARLHPLIVAIIAHENAGYRYPPETVEEGLRLAGVVKPAEQLIAVPKAATTAAVTAATVGGAGAAAELVQHISPVVTQLMPAIQQANSVAANTSSADWARAVIALVVLVAAGASIYTWWKLRRARQAVSP